MAASALAAYATYPDNVSLNEVVLTLRQAGFDKESVCLMLSPTHPMAILVRESSTHPFDRAAGVGSEWMGWLCELGAVVIPTFGFFIRSRSFYQALVANRHSAAGCGRRSTLISLGFSDRDAERFEDHLPEVGTLLYVACSEGSQPHWAVDLLRASGAEEVGVLESEAAMEAVAH